MSVLSVDFETRSTVELKRTGVYPYARHRDTGLWCFAWAFDDEEPLIWVPGTPVPERIAQHITEGGELRAWNAAFERIMWRDCGVPRYGLPPVANDQWHCTMVESMAQALPAKLEKAALVLGLATQKDMAGNRLMQQMCRPRRFDEDTPVWWDTPEKLERLYVYCRQDVRAERSAYHKLRRLNERERAIYLLDQRINDRGVHLDYQLATKARGLAETEINRQNALLAEATDGAVGKVMQVGKLKAWIGEQGLATESLNKAALAELLAPGIELSEEVRTALGARQEAGKSSIAKIDAMLDCVGWDNRMRGLLQYFGASTGRWAGRLVQPQNFPRGLDVKDVESYIPKVMQGEPLNSDSVLSLFSAMLRSMLTAAPGRVLLAGDFAAIEARVVAWLAEQTNLVTMFAEGVPVYKEMAARIYGCAASDIAKPSPEYQLGKNTVLGCGFGMGWKKFMETTGVPETMARLAVDTYRTTFPSIPNYWTMVNAAAISAVNKPGEVFRVGKVKFCRANGYLWVVLPAGRSLAYPAPRIVDRLTPWGEMRPAVEFSGMSSYMHQWERQALYGGLITENIVQAIARDLLADAMVRVEGFGYSVVLTSHDEIVAEIAADDKYVSLDAFLNLMKEVPAWAAGCPIDAEGWRGERYRK